MGGLGILLGNLITTQKSCYIILPYKFMSGFLYFSNNLKYIKDHIQTDVISYKIFFQLMVTVSKEKLNLQLPLIFYSSIRFVFETAFISEKIAENRFGALLEINDKFITKFNVFSYMILQFRLNSLKNFKTILDHFKNRGYNQFHIILRLFDVLPNFPFITSETMGNYYL